MLTLLALARSVLFGTPVRAALTGAGGGLALPGFFGDDDGRPRRRRRRRALTASDKADIAFISGTLGKPAGKDFAMIVAART